MTSTSGGTSGGTPRGSDLAYATSVPASSYEPASSVPQTPRKVLVYSDDVNTRAQVLLAVGVRPASDLPSIEYIETATEPATIARLDVGDIDVAVLDGEAVPAGGMGICRQLKDEIYDCPPVLILIGRPHDGWLATWSRADAVASHPLDPMVVAEELTRLLRQRMTRPAVTS